MSQTFSKKLAQVWDLDSFFPGGSESAAFQEYLGEIKKKIHTFGEAVNRLEPPLQSSDIGPFTKVIDLLQQLVVQIREASAFTSCLTAQNMRDKKAVLLGGQVKSLLAGYQSHLTSLDQKLMQIPDDVWDEIVRTASLKPIAFPLDERRRAAQEKLAPEQEALVNDLAVDGYHGWSELYNTTVGKMTIPFEENGEVQELSVGQASNKLNDKNKQVRDKMFETWEETWSENADFCADALNHLGGFRLSLYKHRGWDHIHKEPLDYNRMSEQTLHAMWDTIDKNKDLLLKYFERKAKLLGVEKLGWNDVSTPIGNTTKSVSYDEAAAFIVKHFKKFSPKMADFTVQVFEKSWIEAEDRAGKRPGGFCTSFPDSKQTRIFMTYSGTASNVATLAHELGHAYHQHVMNDLQPLAQQYAMNVAETASTFAELIVSDAAVKEAKDDEEKLVLLDDKIQRAVAFFMNIHARFIFESHFYEERKKGLVSVERLNELMVEAQKEAYKDSLSSYHPHFWASKLHFYMTRVPFYNFPYTFGYLFSAGVYSKALEGGQGFEDQYIALLRDTASMPVEELASQHLGIDLTQSAFWQSAISLVSKDIDTFLQLSE